MTFIYRLFRLPVFPTSIHTVVDVIRWRWCGWIISISVSAALITVAPFSWWSASSKCSQSCVGLWVIAVQFGLSSTTLPSTTWNLTHCWYLHIYHVEPLATIPVRHRKHPNLGSLWWQTFAMAGCPLDNRVGLREISLAQLNSPTPKNPHLVQESKTYLLCKTSYTKVSVKIFTFWTHPVC